MTLFLKPMTKKSKKMTNVTLLLLANIVFLCRENFMTVKILANSAVFT
jgi:hypothetical protein